MAPLTALTVPFRAPIQTANTTNNLLVPLYFVIAASALAWLVPVLWSRRAEAQFQAARAQPSQSRAEPLLFEKLLGAFIVLYALQALYSPSAGFVKAVQNEVFFYVPFALLFARLRDLDWTRQLLIRCLQVTAVLAVAFSLIGFVEEATKHLLPLIGSKLVIQNELHEYFTVNSVFLDPNIFGRYLALVMILLTAVLLYDRRTRVQLASLGAIAILWGCLVFTLSRSSLVALGLGLGVLAALRWKTRPVLYLAAAVIIAGGIAVAVRPGSFGLSKASGGINGLSSGRGEPDHQWHQAAGRPPALRLRLGLVLARVLEPLPKGSRVRLGFAQHPRDGRGGAGDHRRAGLPRARHHRDHHAVPRRSRRPVPGRDRRRLPGVAAAHDALRGLPRGPGHLDAAGRRGLAGDRGARRATA